jgi:hypothetical protein
LMLCPLEKRYMTENLINQGHLIHFIKSLFLPMDWLA